MADESQRSYHELEEQFLQEMDSFCNDWIEVFKLNNQPIGMVGGTMRCYANGQIEDLPGPLILRFCPICKQRPADMEWLDYEEDHFIENGQEFITRGSLCQCEDQNEWLVTYKLLSIKMEQLKEGKENE